MSDFTKFYHHLATAKAARDVANMARPCRCDEFETKLGIAWDQMSAALRPYGMPIGVWHEDRAASEFEDAYSKVYAVVKCLEKFLAEVESND